MNWQEIQSLYDQDPKEHWERCQARGLVCPSNVFEQIFWDHHTRPDFELRVRAVRWINITWEEIELSGVALRQVYVDRASLPAVDEARHRTLQEGLYDDREEVIRSWTDEGIWMRSPVIVAGDVMGNSFRYELLVGRTRLGNLLGLLDRQEIAETSLHRVWYGVRAS